MQTNNLFTFQRFAMLCKQSLIINKKLIGISLVGFSGTLFLILMLNQAGANFSNWENNDYLGTFAFLFFVLGIIYVSHSFTAFRSKEKSMTYLMLPASASEKFLFELVSRIIVFILLMPLLFWVIANLEGSIVHYFVPRLENYEFSFGNVFSEITNPSKFDGWAKFAILQGGLFVFISSFTGACYFSKSPLLKTMFTISIIAAGYGLFTFLLIKGLNLEAFHAENNRVLFIKNDHDAMVFLAIAVTMINLCLLTIAFFRLKEKEA
ncbi:MAG: hypothetical protein NTY07_11390 [Bacteroidia bacterium]|nr:hypothetical protein [Bacteroidia bacterium]